MLLKIKFNSKWNVISNGMTLKIECHSKWYVTQNGTHEQMDWDLGGQMGKAFTMHLYSVHVGLLAGENSWA